MVAFKEEEEEPVIGSCGREGSGDVGVHLALVVVERAAAVVTLDGP